jgi:hypothetical protein
VNRPNVVADDHAARRGELGSAFDIDTGGR